MSEKKYSLRGGGVIINFDSRGGTSVASQHVQKGSLIQLPIPPTKRDSIAVGWYRDPQLTHSFNFTRDVVNENITLYAKWATDAYKVQRLEIVQHYAHTPDNPYNLLVQKKSYAVRLFITNKNATDININNPQNTNQQANFYNPSTFSTSSASLPNPDFKVYIRSNGITRVYPIIHPRTFPNITTYKNNFDAYEYNMFNTSYAVVPAWHVQPGKYHIEVKQGDYLHTTASINVIEPYSIKVKVVPINIISRYWGNNNYSCNTNYYNYSYYYNNNYASCNNVNWFTKINFQVMDSMKNYMLNRMPFSDVNISKRHNILNVEVENTDVCLQSSNNEQNNDKGWVKISLQLAILQATEQGLSNDAPTYYYGVIPTCPNNWKGGTTGLAAGIGNDKIIGNDNLVLKNAPALSAIGRIDVPDNPNDNTITQRGDKMAQFYRTFLHEMGHTLNLLHILCNNEGGSDTEYPYDINVQQDIIRKMFGTKNFTPSPTGSYGLLPITPIVNRNGLNDEQFNLRNPYQSVTLNYTPYNNNRYPSTYPPYTTPSYQINTYLISRITDIMSYCNGTFFSDYSFNKIQKYLLGYGKGLRPAYQSTDQQYIRSNERILIAGTVHKGQLTLRPVQSSVANFTTPNRGNYTLRIRTKNGSVERNFQAQTLFDITDMQHFFVFLDLKDDIEDIQVFKDGKLLPKSSSSADQAKPPTNKNNYFSRKKDGLTATTSTQQLIQAIEQGNNLQIVWNQATHPYLQVVHIAPNGERNVLTLETTGGYWTYNTTTLPSGGYFDITISTGLKIYRHQLQRK